MSTDNKILAIIGMHRSGTSLTTNWLQKCGLNIGTELEGKHFSNPDGHFEDIDFLKLHEEILKSDIVPYHGCKDPNDFNINAIQKSKIKDLLDKKNESPEWGWKDPRTCLFLETYRELLPHAYYLIILRPYAEIIDSLLRRIYAPVEKRINSGKLGKLKLLKYKWTIQRRDLKNEIEYYEKAVINYYASIIEHLKQIDNERRVCFKLDDIQDVDETIVNHLNSKMGFSLSYYPISNIFQKKYLKSNPKFYKHNTKNTAALEKLQKELDAFCDY
nr:hypothetical protein [uncultured Psychroserpens sp.]